MTNKEFQNLKKGDRVMFQQCGGNKINGHIVAVADIWENGQIVVPGRIAETNFVFSRIVL